MNARRIDFLKKREAECRATAVTVAEPTIRTEYLRFADHYAQQAISLRDRMAAEARQAGRLAAQVQTGGLS
ncbi:hypothetical protein ACFB49_06080 [Sphingomonas sp. DBB INV C78]|uniref:hypothetical protein n=1 Tax=Sphingomonas sp. DBB INV C78 TaxID=3349434 RepID=UPI0036D341DC